MSDDEEEEFCFEDGADSQDQILETLLEAVTSDDFHFLTQTFASKHCDKFNDSDIQAGAEHKHDHFLLFQEYKDDIEKALNQAMSDAGVEFGAHAFAESMKNRKDCVIFDEVADILNSINDFKAFKGEMLAFKASRGLQDLAINSTKTVAG